MRAQANEKPVSVGRVVWASTKPNLTASQTLTMADGFSDPNLFAEFDRVHERTDKILMTKFKDLNNEPLVKNNDIDRINDGGGVACNFDSSSDDDSSREMQMAKHENETETGSTFMAKPGSLMETVLKSEASELSKLQLELHRLRKEYDQLQKQARVISTAKYGKQENRPAIQVVFMNSEVASKHHATIELFLAELLARHPGREDNPEERIRPSVVCLDDEKNAFEKTRQMRESTVIGCSQMYHDYIIDSLGWCLTAFNPAASDGWDSPNYDQVFHVAIPDELDENACPQMTQRSKRPKQTCFNCDGSHNISDCKEPFNAAKVAKNKQTFRQAQGPQKFPKSSSRYHLGDPKYDKMKPGKISSELRSALGISDNQLPMYIYNMRSLGYPPGHQHALTVDTSGLSMFDKHGEAVSVDGEPGEDGEVDASSSNSPSSGVDVSKLIEYPGFNVPKGKGVVDEHKLYRKPEFSSQQSKERMVKQLGGHGGGTRGVKRQSTDNGHNNPKRKRSEVGVNMDISDPGTPQKGPRSPDNMSSDELHLQKAMLQAQLVLSEGDSADMQVVDSCEGDDLFVPPLPPTPVRPPIPDSTPPVTPTTNTPRRTGQQDSFIGGTPTGALFKTPENSRLMKTPSTGGSVSKLLCTPMNEKTPGISDKTKGLPDADKFSDGIQQDIPFENLPGATGTFDKMTKLLKHLRSRPTST